MLLARIATLAFFATTPDRAAGAPQARGGCPSNGGASAYLLERAPGSRGMSAKPTLVGPVVFKRWAARGECVQSEAVSAHRRWFAVDISLSLGWFDFCIVEMAVIDKIAAVCILR